LPDLDMVCINKKLLRGATNINTIVVIGILKIWRIDVRLLIVSRRGVEFSYHDNKENEEDWDGKLNDVADYTTLVEYPVLVEESTELSHSIDFINYNISEG